MSEQQIQPTEEPDDGVGFSDDDEGVIITNPIETTKED